MLVILAVALGGEPVPPHRPQRRRPLPPRPPMLEGVRRGPPSPPNAGGSRAAVAAVPAPLTPLRFAYSAISANTTPFWVALEQGYFQEAGFDVEAVFLGASASMQALLADEVALAIVGPEGIDVNLEYGSPVTRYVGRMQTKLVFKLLANPSIQSVQDLRGKTMSASRARLDGVLRRPEGVRAERPQPGHGRVDALRGEQQRLVRGVHRGLADATMGAPPRDVQAIKQGRAMLLDLGQLDVPYFGAGMIVRDAYATANAALVEQFLRPYLRGVATAHAEPARWR